MYTIKEWHLWIDEVHTKYVAVDNSNVQLLGMKYMHDGNGDYNSTGMYIDLYITCNVKFPQKCCIVEMYN